MELDLDALERIATRPHINRAESFVTSVEDVLALIVRVRELEAIVNDGGNQAAKYWTRLTAAEREMHARELRHFEEEKLRAEAEAKRDGYRELARRTELQCQDAEREAGRYRAAIEAVRKYIHSDKGIDLSEMAPGGIILGILTHALNDKETN